MAMESGTAQEIAFAEPPRPSKYEIGMRVSCGSKNYDIVVENSGGTDSRLVHATANGAHVVFHSNTDDNDLASSLQGIGVISITPATCNAETGEITLRIEAYDPDLDGNAGQDGHVILTFIPHAP